MEKDNDFRRTAVTLGKFDGVHIGHQRLIRKVTQKRSVGMKAVVITFDRPPSVLVDGIYGIRRTILTNEERKKLLHQLGVEEVLEFSFTEQFMKMSAEQFVKEVLVEQLQVKYIAVGPDFRFGYRRLGTPKLLTQLGKVYDFDVEIIEKKCMVSEPVSSSRIRSELVQGEMEKANKLLGYRFFIEGLVEKGEQKGRSFGFPTINIPVENQKQLPPKGVYFSRVETRLGEFCGVTNIGVKPTVSRKGIMGVETYMYSFDKEFYGEKVKVELCHFLRKEKQFLNSDQLIEQIRLDMAAGKRFFAE